MTKNSIKHGKTNSVTDGPTIQPTDRPTNRVTYRVACTQLKNVPDKVEVVLSFPFYSDHAAILLTTHSEVQLK